ncbi:FAD-dependent oxidoreductase [Salmonella enterica]|nr:FAD-binding protein [Salmonella enterica]EGZ4033027.1 NAD(P)-binding protein [Salmonella enterica subsp. enterica serovar Javiana]HCX7090139.1 FAD-dependent oxidoreductase [Salmonella enterica subsp. enterica]ECE1413819.1 FAD-binding protein [Salmonella enterica]ELS7235317.1 FAD-dependent oxidoreductase [Salmonella enterica]
MSNHYDVIIVGAGPAGLAAARALVNAGVKDILLIEREQEAGGVPRHCRHPTFGLQTFYRPMNGHNWIDRLLGMVVNACEIRTGTTVVNINPGGEIHVSSDRGLEKLFAKRVILATGVRETPRHPRLVSGVRPQGVLTTGALQQFIYLKKLKPGYRPVIVGSELVSFSALWTLRNAGIKTLALIDENERITAFRPAALFAHLMGVKLFLGARITKINGTERVESIEFTDAHGMKSQLECDSIIFTGRFVGEYTLVRQSHLAHETESGRPLFDQYNRCSDPCYYIAGNMAHPADMGDQCYQEGLVVGQTVAQSLRENNNADFIVPVKLDELFRISAPNQISGGSRQNDPVTLNVRVNRYHKGEIIVRDGERELYRATHRCLPERRILLKEIDISKITPESKLKVITK